jgi:hypothetical protein
MTDCLLFSVISDPVYLWLDGRAFAKNVKCMQIVEINGRYSLDITSDSYILSGVQKTSDCNALIQK